MSSSPININNVLPQDCTALIIFFSDSAPNCAKVCKIWCAAAEQSYQYTLNAYLQDGKVCRYLPEVLGTPCKAVKQTYLSVMSRTKAPHIQAAMSRAQDRHAQAGVVTLDRPSPGLQIGLKGFFGSFFNAVEQTYRIATDRTVVSGTQLKVPDLNRPGPLALGPVLEIVEDANLVRLFEVLLNDQIPADEQPKLEGDLAGRSATLREWMENHQASLDRIVELPRYVDNERLKRAHLTTLSPEIGKCTNLQKLFFRYNHGVVLPKELFQMTSLTSLSLDVNALTTLPQEISQLTSLTSLYLSNNALTTLPQEIGQLTRLTDLHCNANPMTHLPPQIGQLTNLKVLVLSENKQLGVLPKEIGQLRNLGALILSTVSVHPRQTPSSFRWIADVCILDKLCEALKKGTTEKALKIFEGLSTDTKNAIYGELHKIMHFPNDSLERAEYAFLGIDEQGVSNEMRLRATNNLLWR